MHRDGGPCLSVGRRRTNLHPDGTGHGQHAAHAHTDPASTQVWSNGHVPTLQNGGSNPWPQGGGDGVGTGVCDVAVGHGLVHVGRGVGEAGRGQTQKPTLSTHEPMGVGVGTVGVTVGVGVGWPRFAGAQRSRGALRTTTSRWPN